MEAADGKEWQYLEVSWQEHQSAAKSSVAVRPGEPGQVRINSEPESHSRGLGRCLMGMANQRTLVALRRKSI